MRSLPKFLGLAVAAGILTLGAVQQAAAQCCPDPTCCKDSDCADVGGNVCGGLVCSWANPAKHACVDPVTSSDPGWCCSTDADPGCKCTGATCVGTACSFVVPQLPDAGPNPCNVDSECGSCGMVCSYSEDGGTGCVLADGGDVGHCDTKIGNSTCACMGQICAVATDTCYPPFNVLDAGPNPCNVDSECGACGTVCFHDVSGTHACLGQVDAGLPGGFCLQTADCACTTQTCDTTTNFCNFPDAGPPVDAGTTDAGPGADGGPVVYCTSDHDCANPLLGSGDGCGWVCGSKSTRPYKCVPASSGDPGICNVSGSNDCLTCGGVTQTCDTSSHTCTPPQYVPDGGPPPDAGTPSDGGGAVDSGTNPDSGVKTCQVDADCGQLDQVCSHKTTPYHCVLASTGDPGYCTTGGSTNPCPAQGQTCISNVCTPPYGYDAGETGTDGGSSGSSGCGSAPAKGGPDLGALLLALGLAGAAGLAGRRRRRLQ